MFGDEKRNVDGIARRLGGGDGGGGGESTTLVIE